METTCSINKSSAVMQTITYSNTDIDYCHRHYFGAEERGLLSCQVASALSLESNNDICDLQISFLFQMSQHTSSEEDFTLSNSEQVGIKF